MHDSTPAMRPPRPWRVVLADDHAVVRDGLRGLAAAHPDIEVVGEAGDAEAVSRLVDDLAARGEAPDVVVMDVSMPAGAGGADGAEAGGRHGGVAATARIRAEHPGVRVLALSMHEDRAYLRSLLEAGASGYALKRSAADELIRALRAVAAGGTYLDPALSTAVVLDTLAPGTAAGTAAGGIVGAAATSAGMAGGAGGAVVPLGPRQWPLSEREGEVLRLIAQGYTNKEIAARIGVSIKTVETYKARGMEKLGLDGRAELMRYALALGWLQ